MTFVTAARPRPQGLRRLPDIEKIAATCAIVLLAIAALAPCFEQSIEPELGTTAETARHESGPVTVSGRETVVSAYISQPFYLRSDAKLARPDDTNMVLKQLGWDGDALSPPIDGGGRVVTWNGPFGTMVDFLHNKAVSRLGVGAHGRKKANGIIDIIETTGLLRGKPAPDRLRLTDLFERFEFTHGHNVLLFNGLMRLGGLGWGGIRPYFGVGAGVAVPHVEVIFAGEKDIKPWTDEYQYAGPAAQAVAGLEFRTGRVSYFVEYKLSWASISGALTGEHSLSWKKSVLVNYLPAWMVQAIIGLIELPSDLSRQFGRWRAGEEPSGGRFSTTLTANQIAAGVGYVWPRPGGTK